MEILVVGATGLLGANLAHSLCRHGLVPRLLARPHASRAALSPLACPIHEGDLFDANSLQRALRGVTHVVNAAGLFRFDPASASALFHVHVEGTRALVQAARHAKVRRLVHVSALAALGHGPLSAPVTEATHEPLDGHAQAFAASKRASEEVALAEAGPELEVVVVNPPLAVGAYETSTGALISRLAQSPARLYPTGGQNFVNAKDVAEGILLALERGRPGERYILGGENLTYREFLTQCAGEANAAAPRLPLPRPLARAAGRAGDWAGWLFPEPARWLNSSVLGELYQVRYASSLKAERELGYRPRPVRLGIREALRWLQEQGQLPRDRPLAPRGLSAA